MDQGGRPAGAGNESARPLPVQFAVEMLASLGVLVLGGGSLAMLGALLGMVVGSFFDSSAPPDTFFNGGQWTGVRIGALIGSAIAVVAGARIAYAVQPSEARSRWRASGAFAVALAVTWTLLAGVVFPAL